MSKKPTKDKTQKVTDSLVEPLAADAPETKPPLVKPPIGRPTLYTADLADAICEMLAYGNSLIAILNEPGMPNYSTVMRWLTEKPEFKEKYTRARDFQADYLAEDVIRIADETGQDGQRQRLRFDARRWWVSKVLPKKYGEKTEVEHTGSITLEAMVLGSMKPKTDGEEPKG